MMVYNCTVGEAYESPDAMPGVPCRACCCSSGSWAMRQSPSLPDRFLSINSYRKVCRCEHCRALQPRRRARWQVRSVEHLVQRQKVLRCLSNAEHFVFLRRRRPSNTVRFQWAAHGAYGRGKQPADEVRRMAICVRPVPPSLLRRRCRCRCHCRRPCSC